MVNALRWLVSCGKHAQCLIYLRRCKPHPGSGVFRFSFPYTSGWGVIWDRCLQLGGSKVGVGVRLSMCLYCMMIYIIQDIHDDIDHTNEEDMYCFHTTINFKQRLQFWNKVKQTMKLHCRLTTRLIGRQFPIADHNKSIHKVLLWNLYRT
jgi:hypothetical protein